MNDLFVCVNPNPRGKSVGDCTVRAISIALNQPWKKTYLDICLKGLEMCDMPSANAIWSSYLRDKGFVRHIIPHELGLEYTVSDFAADNPKGTYILALDGHVVCVKNSKYYDTWDSGNGFPLYYWSREE